MTSEDYAKRAAQWAKALKLLDPSIILILCGETGHATWDFEVLKACITFIDMDSIHIYTCSNSHLPNVTAPLAAERAIEVAAGLIDLARIEAKIPPSKSRVSPNFQIPRFNKQLTPPRQPSASTNGTCGTRYVPPASKAPKKPTPYPMPSLWQSGSTSSSAKANTSAWRT